MKKILLTILLLLIIASQKAWAVNLDVTCDTVNHCQTSPSSGAALFDEPDLKPSYSTLRKITVTNNDPDEDCWLTLGTKNPTDNSQNRYGNLVQLTPVLRTAIWNSSTNYYGLKDGTKASNNKYLSQLFTAGDISLGMISKNGGLKIFNWAVTMDPLAGNEYQGLTAKFDFDLDFVCDFPQVTPTPTPTNGDDGGGGTGGGGTSYTCDAQKPIGTPFLSVVAGSEPNSVLLTWTPISPVTHYMIWYGTTSGNFIYGNANVGNVTSYLVKGLSAGTYYFQVTGVNDCMPGNWSNEARVGATGQVFTVPAESFAPILGEKTATPSAEIIDGTVSGVETDCCQKIEPWWWILLILQSFILVRYFLRKIAQKNTRDWELFVIVTSLGAIILHWWLHRGFVNSLGYIECQYCSWFWLMAIVQAVVLSFIYKLIIKEE